MIPVYMPFTCLAEPTARLLAGLVGPVAVYQPVDADMSASLVDLADRSLITIRTPMTGDEDRLRAALAEFTEWARMNPGRSTAGTGFVGTRQGEVPHFDEDAVNQIRAEIRRYGSAPDDSGIDAREAAFSARLFLAVAQENDQTTEGLDDNLRQFQAMEKGFVESLGVDGEADFSRQPAGSGIWREDPGARQTGQRIRAWATLAACDDALSGLLVTTSPAVVETLQEMYADRLGLETIGVIDYAAPDDGRESPLAPVLAGMVGRPELTADDATAFHRLAGGASEAARVRLTLLAAHGHAPQTVVGELAAAPSSASPNVSSETARHTLILLVENPAEIG